ncbi:ATP-binding protein [Parabacteroides sp. AF17-3]|uniref:ATP-binding protein n=1 Tax=Parabacteroides sp. AF17-3 TaxID=2293113 RepID=UPI000EFEFDB0|nr:AAA family ATPase [Parabacteroides sp. AF17-3]RKU73652.1 ATP-binding protein [Parabacteroides sp. AF17-3]
MEKLQASFDAMLRSISTTFHRYMFNRINWDNRLLGLVGPRGIGKTTLMLQYAKEKLNRNTTLFVNADDLYFSAHHLVDLADEFVKRGGTHLIIDEIHKYKDWARELKLIYDYHADLKVFFTGSSILDIHKGSTDLSRRAIVYSMQGLSFREYLEMFHHIKIPAYSLTDIIQHRAELPDKFRPYAYFQSYLEQGYYPFSKEDQFNIRLQQVINKTLEVDIPQYAEMSISTTRKLKQLLIIIAQSVPFKPNMSSIATILGVSRNNLSDYFLYLEEAGLIAQLRDGTGGIRGLGKVDKVYLDNPTLMYSLGQETSEIGNIRETFFLNQTRVEQKVITSAISDFQIANYIFEVGGKNKKQKQLQGSENGFIVKDNIEQGYMNVIPLWQFGLNY